ncbi:MAG TPA: hypothetical protein VFR78_08475 [Pyrinomonadaceae bacterium]|nr:hypothetical protein [Pyrinomonadaceae bacterium]
MKKRAHLAVIAFLVAFAVPMVLTSGGSSADSDSKFVRTGMTDADYLLADYKVWEAKYLENGGDRNVVMSLGWFKGLSTEKTNASGQIKLNLLDGIVSVEAEGLSRKESWDVWLVDNGPGSSVTPDANDTMVHVGSLKHHGKLAKLEANLGSKAFADFDPDLYVVTRAGKKPSEERVLVGSTTLFQRLYRSGQRGQFGQLADMDLPRPAPEPAKPAKEESLWSSVVQFLSPTAHAAVGVIPDGGGSGEGGSLTPLDTLINQGRTLFFLEQFNGNGRTCGTCHREDENLAISPEFIATLPANDALFVAEFNPSLSASACPGGTPCFENPVLMRKFGLILENLDGFGDLQNRFVMRGVPHTLALLQNTLTPAPDGTSTPPNERTGWSGDGAPSGSFTLSNGATHLAQGTLRDFPIGAVIQHFTKTLLRRNNIDFRLPTNAELDAMNAFMRSTGRRADLNLSGPGALSLKGEIPREGQRIFNNGGVGFAGGRGIPPGTANGAGKCFFCHFNAGGSDFFFPEQNANFNTNVEQLPSQPADLVVPAQKNPADGGFGVGAPPAGVFGLGDGTFNTPVLVEAADTGPFFHSNVVNTIEEAVNFYNSSQFNNAPGFGAQIGGIRLEATEVSAVGAFLRVINALENIRSALEIEGRARNARFLNDSVDLLRLSISELQDAVDVLHGGGLHPEAQQKLRRAIELDQQALTTSSRSARQALIDEAIALKTSARSDLRN